MKMLQERDSAYSDLKKTKEKYDHQCKEVEAARAKAEKSLDSSKVCGVPLAGTVEQTMNLPWVE